MSLSSKFNIKDYNLIKREAASLLALAKGRCRTEEEFSVVCKALDFAKEAHKNVRRRSGEPYILHPIAVAKIVISDIGLGYKSITTALLHDVVEDTPYTVEDIRILFGDKVALLVDGLTKIKTVLDNEDRKNSVMGYSESIQAENLKRILLTLNDDVLSVDELASAVTVTLTGASAAEPLDGLNAIQSASEVIVQGLLEVTVRVAVPPPCSKVSSVCPTLRTGRAG